MSDIFGVAVISRGEMLFVKEGRESDRFTLDNSDLQEGVNQLVVYNNQGCEVASRLFFVRNGRQQQLSISQTKQGNTALHARQDITFKVADSQGNGVATDFSLAIYDDATAEGAAQQSIYASLLLDSELRGYIPNADYYFKAEDEERAHNLDLVMMVYGWSRYKWDEMSGYAPKEIIFPYEKKLSVYGRVFLHEWKSLPLGTPERQTDWNIRFVRYQEYPTDNIVPCDSPFTLIHSVSKNKYDVSKYSPFVGDGSNNRFSFNYSDFTDEMAVAIGIPNNLIKSNKRDMRIIHITDSEYRPDERLYNFDETSFRRQVAVKEVSDLPRIKLLHYNRGHFSPINSYLKGEFFESLTNRTHTSIERYMDYYVVDKIHKRIDFDHSYSSMASSSFTSTNEQLYFHKLPYGTVSYLSTMIDMRTSEDAAKGYVTTPLTGEHIRAYSGYEGRMSYNFETPSDHYVIDSTIIHTSFDKRMEVYNRYKSHDNYATISIEHWRFEPQLTFSNRCPDYVVEHFGRMFEAGSRPVGSDGRPVIVSSGYPKRTTNKDQRKRVFMLQGFERVEREFYSPDYSVVAPPTSGDHRRTLYWNPNVESDAEGRATVTFYNNSQGGSYTIDAQTITAEGQIGSTAR
ncbi:MAG: hypothetical protein SNH63_06705 [Rikenellaceae bacterium]